MIAPPPFLAAWLKPVRPLTAARIIRKARSEASLRGKRIEIANLSAQTARLQERGLL